MAPGPTSEHLLAVLHVLRPILPKGSISCPFKNAGSKTYTWYGVWKLSPSMGSIWTLRVMKTIESQEVEVLTATEKTLHACMYVCMHACMHTEGRRFVRAGLHFRRT